MLFCIHFHAQIWFSIVEMILTKKIDIHYHQNMSIFSAFVIGLTFRSSSELVRIWIELSYKQKSFFFFNKNWLLYICV